MAVGAQQQREAWNYLREHWDPTLGPGLSKVDLDAAAAAVDTWCDANQASFVAALPQPFKGASSAAQKGLLLAVITLKRTGVI